MSAAAPQAVPQAAIDEAHAFVRSVAVAQLGATSCTLRNGISSHVIRDPVSLQSVQAFCTRVLANTNLRRAQIFVSSLDGSMHVSVHIRAPDATDALVRKRSRDGDGDGDGDRDRATRAVERAQEGVAQHARISVETLAVAHGVIGELLRTVKGTRREDPFESCGLHIARRSLDTTRASAVHATPRLVIGCRMSAGIAVPLGALCTALGPCVADGMLTTKAASIGADYQLPESAESNVATSYGQSSLLLFAAMPSAAALPPETQPRDN